jgi:hypothetical protein
MSKNAKLALCGFIVFAITLLLPGCGPLTPHVDVNANVSGSVNTSGIISVDISETSLQNFFMTQCQNSLGSSATPAQIQACETTELSAFLNLVGAPVPSPSPSST